MPISIDKFPVPVSILAIHFASISSTTACDDDIAARKKLLTTVDSVNCRGRRAAAVGQEKKPVPSVFGDFFLWTAARMLFSKLICRSG